MSKEIYISSTPHETRLAIVENDALTEIYYERENEYTLAGSIYNGKVTRVLPGMQSSFVEIGLERDAFLYITDFLEEAPDSAEFDTGESSTRGPRLPRLDAAAQTEQPRLEGARPEGQRNDVPRSDGPRSEGQRGEGRNERGGRGRRGRGDRQDRPDRPQAAEPSRIEAGTESPHLPPMTAPPEGDQDEPSFTATPDAADLGEGAPGADGSRRWRGRRGRRRGRGTGTAATAPGAAETAIGQTGFPLYPASEAEPVEHISGSVYEGAAHRIEAFAHTEPAAPVEPPSDTYNESRRSYRGQEDGRAENAPADRGSRDRNFRGDRERGGPGRGERADRGGRTDRAPRDFAPAQPRYGVEELPDAPVGDPIILPGESLSKYRKGDPAPTPTQTVAAPAPSSEFVITAPWDGGATLPGESLARRPRSEPRAELRPQTHIPLRNPAPPVPAQPAAEAPHARVIEDEEGSSVAVTPEEQPEVAFAAHPEHVPPADILHEPAAVVAQPEPSQPELSQPEPDQTYEPTKASASHRVDPVAPSEYRHTAFADEIESPAPAPVAPLEHAALPDPAASIEHTAAPAAPDELPFGHTHFLTPEPAFPQPLAAEEPVGQPASDLAHTVVDEIGTSLPGHDITTLSAAGDMISEPPAPELFHPEAALAPQQEPQPTSPILHETVIVDSGDITDLVEEQAGADETEEAETTFFSPGQGDLEEELIDDDDFDIAALHAAHDDENEDLEEETLEGAADLGTMLREMSIDQITRSAAPGEEEDDFEEDLLEDTDEPVARATPYIDTDEAEEGSEDYARTAESAGDFSSDFREPNSEPTPADTGSYNDRARNREPRRGNRDRQSRGGDSSGRPRNTGGSGDRDPGRTGRTGRGSMQTTNLPAISDLLKPGQEILVQIAKEPMAKKGARITSHIALPGRFLVFMPTVSHTGVSRKIESDAERRRLKEILLSEKGEAAGGFIVRTAAASASEEELRSDLRFLLNLWADIKQRSESSKSPALIYHDLNLVERILRDQVTDTFSAIWVDTETEYERVLRFLQRFQPGLIRRVKLYLKETPLFEQFGITEEINKALRSKVWLKSGGSIVINQTEALVAIDINTGKFVGKTARLEDTIVKTNLDAIPEIVRQIRLRDLGGIIIIDFIDMDERKNRNKVMAALEEELKSDRAPSKVLQFNDFGLVAITRKRVKQSLERTLSTTCNVCVGTGMVKSPVTVCNDIYIEMRKMVKHLDKGDVMLRVHPEVVKQLKSPGTRWLQEMEEISGKTILVKSDPSLHPEQFDIH